MRRTIALRGWVLVLLGLGCAPRVGGAAFAPQAIELPAQPPPPDIGAAEATIDEPVIVFEPTNDAGTSELPASWSRIVNHTTPFAEAVRAAHVARTAFEAALGAVRSKDGGIPTGREFESANALLEQSSRRFAAAYHAPDATNADKVETLREGAAMILGWSRRLDEAGLARAPSSYRSDPAIALTFEDVANGPAKRWRQEGVALVALCVESARAAKLDSAAARECADLRRTYAHVIALRPTRADAGASACGCDPGDPLCSASMSGWCPK